MDIFIYKTFEDWVNDAPSETIYGSVNFLRNSRISIDSLTDDHKAFRQMLSFNKIFAIVYKLPSGFLTYKKEINIYQNFDSWSVSSPDESIEGYICEDECSDNYVTFITPEGYKQILSLNNIFAITYER